MSVRFCLALPIAATEPTGFVGLRFIDGATVVGELRGPFTATPCAASFDPCVAEPDACNGAPTRQ
ncbi:hypothetical protein [Anaeromyxobacter oryzae]|uniref:Uncharacterized protein n=1 Tax=Anaeromyxobacter oryzae TaxID=2918170 RepID=A0ABN6N1B7_9BACT|nr:hypothetical protein [Anaeromyxobacter oryzae]BDG06355.1 hypothetical protein AMOR_53510 [Anaeromyxobacter oryzae]